VTIDRLSRALESPEPEVRRRAVIALAESGEAEVAELLLLALGDQDWRVRKEAARVATALAQPLSLLPDLTAAVGQSDNVGLRNAAIEVLGKLGPDVASDLLAALDHVPQQGKKFLVAALGEVGGEAVVAALARLAAEPDTNLAAAAVDALARIGGDGATRALRACLRADDTYLRLAALDALERLDTRLTWEELETLLSDRLLRRVALRALGHTGSVRAVPVLLEALEEPSAHVVGSAAAALYRLASESGDAERALGAGIGRIGESARGALRELSSRGDQETRRGAALLGALLCDAEAIDGIVELAVQEELPALVARALREWGGGAVEPLLDVYAREVGVRRAVALELAADLSSASSVATDRVAAALRDAASDPEVEVKLSAARSIPPFAAAGDTDLLVRLARTPDERVARAAADALEALAEREHGTVERALEQVSLDGPGGAALTPLAGRMLGERALERLSAALSVDDPATRRAAIRALTALGGELAVEHIALALADEDVDVQIEATRALGELRDHEGRPVGADALLLALGSSTPAVQAAAARSLGAIAEGRAVEPLRELLRDGAPGVAVAAMEALRALGDPTIGDLLVEALGHGDDEVVKQALSAIRETGVERTAARLALGLSHAAWHVRCHAADELGAAGGEDARAALLARLAEEKDDLVRAAIERALGSIGEEA
jgi:HEAT repeat protein